MSIDTDRFREALAKERAQLRSQIEHHDIGNSSLTDETGEAALGRIDDGTYGKCAVCGRQIPDERLEAVPWATLCIDDARKQGR